MRIKSRVENEKGYVHIYIIYAHSPFSFSTLELFRTTAEAKGEGLGPVKLV